MCILSDQDSGCWILSVLLLLSKHYLVSPVPVSTVSYLVNTKIFVFVFFFFNHYSVSIFWARKSSAEISGFYSKGSVPESQALQSGAATFRPLIFVTWNGSKLNNEAYNAFLPCILYFYFESTGACLWVGIIFTKNRKKSSIKKNSGKMCVAQCTSP